MIARIFQPTKTAMQSGQANTRFWIIEYEPEEAKKIDSLTGWTGSGDMRGQIKLKFNNDWMDKLWGESGLSYQLLNDSKFEINSIHFYKTSTKYRLYD